MSEQQTVNLNLGKLKELRHWLHAHPEVSRQEVKTSKYMQDYLQTNSPPDEIISLAGAGFAAVYNGTKPGKTVLIRAELDALPIHEINQDLSYRSVHDGVGHKCGHDGHMTILAGLAQIYSIRRPTVGRLVLLYQPDEETGTGAKECASHPNFKQIEPDIAFALHNFPSFPEHQIICKTGTFTSSVKFAAMKLSGREAHSAMPETGISPAVAIAQITLAAQEVQQQYDTPEEYALIVPVFFQMGISSSGVCPGYGEAHYTLRSCRDEVVEAMWGTFSKKAAEIARQHGLEIEFEILEEFAANFNNDEAVEMVRKAARNSNFEYNQIEKPFRGGEDFGEITKRYKGAMFGLGSGLNKPELHNPDYDFPDEIIETGVRMFEKLVRDSLESGHR